MPHVNLGAEYNLYYEQIGGDSARPHLVFLHEGLGCSSMWGDFPKLLCKVTGCPGLLYDRLGYGLSSPAASVRSQRYLNDYALQELPATLKKTIANAPYLLIGHSDGGTIALIHGAQQPPHLQAIITEAAHVFVDPETIAGIKAAKKAWDQGKLQKLNNYHGEKTENVFRSWVDTWLAPSFKSWNIEHLLPTIEVPLLVIQGKNDQYGKERQVHAIARQSSGYSETGLIENCGHIPHQEAQESTLQLMTDFIEKMQKGEWYDYGDC